MKQRVYKETGDFTDDVKLQDRGETLTCRKICTESFSQDGHNGGDYIIVVPDERIQQMTPYYSELAVSVKKKCRITCRISWMICQINMIMPVIHTWKKTMIMYVMVRIPLSHMLR